MVFVPTLGAGPTPPHSPQAQVAGPSPNFGAKKKFRVGRKTAAQSTLSFGGAANAASICADNDYIVECISASCCQRSHCLAY